MLTISSKPMFDPSSQVRDYSDIRKILEKEKQPYKEYEEKTDKGTFKRFVIEA